MAGDRGDSVPRDWGFVVLEADNLNHEISSPHSSSAGLSPTFKGNRASIAAVARAHLPVILWQHRGYNESRLP